MSMMRTFGVCLIVVFVFRCCFWFIHAGIHDLISFIYDDDKVVVTICDCLCCDWKWHDFWVVLL